MSQPFISICVPTYQRPQLLKKMLESVREQTFKDVEILINDNSPDDSLESLIRSSFTDLPISYERNEPSVNAGENCRKVIARATGEWIKVMHDDDWLSGSGSLATFADAANKSGKDFIFSATNQVWLEEDKQEDDYLTAAEQKRLDDSVYSLYYINVIGHPSAVMHRRDATIQYDPDFKWLLDLDYYIRYMNAHGAYHYIPEKLVSIGRSSTQETHKYSFNIKVELTEYLQFLHKYGSDLYLRNRYVFHQVWNMIKRYKIKSIEQIREAGYTAALPPKIEQVINFQNKIPRIVIKQPSWSDAIMRMYFKRMTIDEYRTDEQKSKEKTNR